MKGLFYLFLPIVSVCVFLSCSDDFLGETETTDLDREAVFKDSTYTADFLNRIYMDIGFDVKHNRYKDDYNDHGGLQTSCDEAAYKASTGLTTDVMFATGTVNPVTIAEGDVWRIAYQNIRRVNIFFKYADGSRMIETAKTEYKAEARFLRAWYYAMLLRHYGGVALIGDDVYETVEEAMKERNSYAECVEYIVSEANKAAETLPAERSGNKFGRITQGACKALISRIRLYAASKLYNGSDFAPSDFPKELVGYPTYDKERWKTAVDAALDVIKMQKYSLYVRNKDENDKEYPGWGYYAQLLPSDYYGKVGMGVYSGTIFEKKEGASTSTNVWFAPPSTGGNGIGGYIYHDLAELFPMADGTPTVESTEYDPTDPSKNRDPRFMFTVSYDGCSMKSNKQDTEIKIYVGTQQDAIYRGTPTGYYTRKFLNLNSMANQMLLGGSQARPLIRYTEILLNYAEAANEYYGPDHKDVLGEQEISPYIVLRKIRECAGIKPGKDGKYGIEDGMTPDEMTEAIRLERRLDLAFEGHRFFDVRRWMIAEKTDNMMMHGFEITKTETGKTGRVINTRQHTFRKAMYFYPIPYKETVKSPELLQNPYYE